VARFGKWLEKTLQLIVRQIGAVVFNAYLKLGIRRNNGLTDAPMPIHGVDGVQQQIKEYLADLGRW
jgi:hypothetical protein